jgi:phosphoribosyl 1,2-cyclic phosphodiesterase
VRIFVLGSGSSGNCLVVEAEGERLLVDAGIGPIRAQTRMRELGADLFTSHAPLGVLVTHDHGDHSAHALPLARALRAPLIAHERAVLETARRRLEVRAYVPGRPLAVGPFTIEALPVPHDAPQVAVRVAAGPYRFAVATDLGQATRDLRTFLRGCDLVLLESNYCLSLLENGPYPPRLKRRVGGPLGHLANEQAAELASWLEDTRVARLVLVHVSRTNNMPERAREVVAARAPRLNLEVLSDGVSHRFDVIAGKKRPAEQLAFGFG